MIINWEYTYTWVTLEKVIIVIVKVIKQYIWYDYGDWHNHVQLAEKFMNKPKHDKCFFIQVGVMLS